ncbi:MAG: hypothetical protein KJZ91_06020 [Myxococcales bacterium]|nr:hypothetical protein [Myxococcales bacterium]
MSFSPEQVRRYARHVLLPDVGGVGQRRLLAAAARVDAGTAAGRIAAVYLVAAGVGTVALAGVDDPDRRVTTAEAGFPLVAADVGRPLAEALADALAGRNPDVRVVAEEVAGAWRLDLSADDPADDPAVAAGGDATTEAGPAPAGASPWRAADAGLLTDGGALARAFARGAAAAARLVHRIATGGAP